MVTIKILTNKEKNELDNLLKQVSDYDEAQIIDKSLKQKVAKFFLQLINKNYIENDKKTIQEISYIIAAFILYEFEDELDNITEIAGQLELPEDYISGDVIELFNKMKKMLEDYIKQ